MIVRIMGKKKLLLLVRVNTERNSVKSIVLFSQKEENKYSKIPSYIILHIYVIDSMSYYRYLLI